MPAATSGPTRCNDRTTGAYVDLRFEEPHAGVMIGRGHPLREDADVDDQHPLASLMAYGSAQRAHHRQLSAFISLLVDVDEAGPPLEADGPLVVPSDGQAHGDRPRSSCPPAHLLDQRLRRPCSACLRGHPHRDQLHPPIGSHRRATCLTDRARLDLDHEVERHLLEPRTPPSLVG